VSNETAQEIKQHLEGCAGCSAIYEKMKAQIAIPVIDPDQADVDYLKKIRFGSIRRIVISVISVLVLVAVFMFAFTAGLPVSSEDVTYKTYTLPDETWELVVSLEKSNWACSVRHQEGDDAPGYYILEPRKAPPLLIKGNSFTFGLDPNMIRIPPKDLPEGIPADAKVILRLSDGDIVFTADEMKSAAQ
jgi:hypothetical protein